MKNYESGDLMAGPMFAAPVTVIDEKHSLGDEWKTVRYLLDGESNTIYVNPEIDNALSILPARERAMKCSHGTAITVARQYNLPGGTWSKAATYFGEPVWGFTPAVKETARPRTWAMFCRAKMDSEYLLFDLVSHKLITGLTREPQEEMLGTLRPDGTVLTPTFRDRKFIGTFQSCRKEFIIPSTLDLGRYAFVTRESYHAIIKAGFVPAGPSRFMKDRLYDVEELLELHY